MAGLCVRFRSGGAAGAAGFDVDLDLPRHGISALFGPSGSGKTTCLRVIAGLEKIPGAYVAFGGEVWQDSAHFTPTHRRGLGYVFQEASLFPHLTVLANLEFGQRRVPVAERRFALEPIAALLGIAHLLPRQPGSLSGGERQRVAIARALLASPRLLLMDEPLAALDAGRKGDILPYLERVRDELAIPILYVSHALDEVTRLADHLVLLEDGRVRASGALAPTLAQAGLPGQDAGVAFEAALVAHEDDDLSCLAFEGGVLRVPKRAEAVGSRLRCRIGARDVSLALARPGPSTSLNVFPARVAAVSGAGHGQALVRLEVGAAALQALVPAHAVRELGIEAGSCVHAQVNAMTLLPPLRALPQAYVAPPAAISQHAAGASRAGLLAVLRRMVPRAWATGPTRRSA